MVWSNLKSVPVIFICCICVEGRELLDEWIRFAPAWVHGFILNVFQYFSVAVIKVPHDLHKTSEMNAMEAFICFGPFGQYILVSIEERFI